MNLKVFEQPAETGDLVVDAVLAQRMPIGRRIDRDHQLAEPYLGRSGEPHHTEIGADLK